MLGWIRGIQSYSKRAGVAVGFRSTQLRGKLNSGLENQMNQMIKQVESCVALVWLEARTVATPVL